jgi:transposase
VAFPQKRALKEGRTIVFVDQSGFYLLPMVVRTYAPVGKTPILKENLTRDHLSVMSGITLDGKLYMLEQERAFKGEDAVRFLKHLMRQIPGKLLVVWDGSPIHRGRMVKDFLASGASSRLQLEQLPGYAPDLNPDEGVWKHLKCVELRNLCWPEPRGVEDRATQGKGAFEAQEAHHPRLHKAARIRGLGVCAEINNNTAQH